MEFNYFNATEPLGGNNLLFTSRVPGTYLIELGKMKGLGNLGATQCF